MRQPDITPIAETRYKLREDYTYEYKHDGTLYRLTVPKGFKYDGSSVPWFLWWTGLRPDGLVRAAACLHDWLYSMSNDYPTPGNRDSHYYYIRYHKGGEWIPQSKPWTRKQADKLFARAMREAGYAKWKRRAAYIAVRLFGWVPWGN